MKAIDSELEELKSEKADFLSKISELDDLRVGLENSNSKLLVAIGQSSAENEKNDNEIEHLTNEIEKLKIQNEHFATSSETIKNLESQLSAAHANIETLKESVERLNDVGKNSEQLISDLMNERGILEKEAERMKGRGSRQLRFV